MCCSLGKAKSLESQAKELRKEGRGLVAWVLSSSFRIVELSTFRIDASAFEQNNSLLCERTVFFHLFIHSFIEACIDSLPATKHVHVAGQGTPPSLVPSSPPGAKI